MTSQALRDELAAFQALKTDLFQKDFLLTWEHPVDQIKAVLTVAEAFKRLHQEGYSYRCFDTGLAISIFRDNSTRTRFSFASAASALGLSLADLDEQKSQIAHGETVRETANMISFLAEVIGIRDDMYLGEGNRYMREVGAALTEGAQAGVLHRRPSIVNLQCDIDHPTQALADLAWLKEHFGGLEQLRGKKLAMTWAYSPSYGKPLSVPQGVIGLMTRFGMNVVLAHPEGYNLIPEVVDRAGAQARASGGSFQVGGSMEDAFQVMRYTLKKALQIAERYQVYIGIEPHQSITKKTEGLLRIATLVKSDFLRVNYDTGNGYLGWPEHAPYDRVMVTAAPDEVPAALLQQLKIGGVMAIPVGTASQELRILRRTRTGTETS